MKKLIIVVALMVLGNIVFAQTVTELRNTATTFMRQGDYSNAILVLNRAYQMEPGNFAISQDLALNHFYSKDNTKALEYIKPLLDREEAVDQTFQIAGNILKMKNDFKEADKVYKKGLKRFPESGVLYNDYGTLLWMQKDKNAIDQFEKGIQADPNYAENYRNATYYYSEKGGIVWPLIYGEIFLNMNPNSKEAPALRQMLLAGYKTLFTQVDMKPFIKQEPTDFGKSFLETLSKQSSVASQGISPETLTMMRTRFVLDWFSNGNSVKYPYRLFDNFQHLLKSGLFEAYNQWVFGPTQNLQAYQEWTAKNAEAYSGFTNLQKNRVFKMPKGQYYNQK